MEESFMNDDSDVIELREGLRVIVPAGSLIDARNMFLRVVAASGLLGGKPVVCREFLPGLAIVVETSWRMEHGAEALTQSWEMARGLIGLWVETSMPNQGEVVPTPFGLLTLADRLYAGRLAGTMEFERRYGWG
jgi:hypothetical protein